MSDDVAVDVKRRGLWLAFGAVVGSGVVLRAWAAVTLTPSPDAVGFALRSADWSFAEPWASSDREPLWIAVTKVVSGPFGYDLGVMQALTFVLSVATLVVAAVLCRRIATRQVAAVAAVAFLAWHPLLVRDAGLGIREPAATLVIAVGVLAASRRRWGQVAAWAAVLLCLRWELGLVAVVVLVVVSVGVVEVRRPLVGAVAVAVVVMGPFMVSNASAYGDPLHHSNRHAVYFRNLEEAAVAGEDPFSLPRFRGESMSWSAYYLDFLGEESVERAVGGVVSVPASIVTFGVRVEESPGRLVAGWVVLGWLSLTVWRGREPLVVAVVVFGAAGLAGYVALYPWMELRLVSFVLLPVAVAVAGVSETRPVETTSASLLVLPSTFRRSSSSP